MDNKDFRDFLTIQQSFLSFTESDQLVILSKMELMEPTNYQYLSILILSLFIAKPRLVKQYTDFIINKMQQYEPFLPTFINYLLSLANTTERDGINTINYILNQFLEHSLISQQDITTKLQSNVYFSHILLSKKLVLNTTRQLPADNFLRDIDMYSSNDWEKHRQFIGKAINPDPFAEVIFNDDIETLRFLIVEKGKNPNSIIQPSIYDLISFNSPISLLEYSALTSSIKCFKMLLLNGAKITKKIGFYAVSGGDVEIIHICEQKGIKYDLNEKLYLTIKYHHNHLFKWSFENEPSEKDYQNIMNFSNYEAISFINELEYPFHCHSLIQSIESNQFIIFKAIIERGVVEYFSQNKSVMNSICLSKNFDFFEYAFNNRIQLKLDFNHKVFNGLSPLHSACMSGNSYALDFLLKLPEIDINDKTKEGVVSLHYAISNGHLDIVKTLIQNKANPELRTNKNNCCFHFACDSNDIEMVNFVLSICDTSKIDEVNSNRI